MILSGSFVFGLLIAIVDSNDDVPTYEDAVSIVCLKPEELENNTVPNKYRVNMPLEEKKVRIEDDGWASHTISAQIAAILLKETMGYHPIRTTGLKYSEAFNSANQNKVDTNLESWSGHLKEQYRAHVRQTGTVLDTGAVGYDGQVGFYLPIYSVQNNSLEYWKIWLTHPDLDILVKMRTADDTDEYEMYGPPIKVFNPDWCNPWNYTGVGNNCVDIKQSETAYEEGIVETMIKSLKLRMTASWWGFTNMTKYVESKIRKEEGIAFKIWIPTQFVSQYDLVRITFPRHNSYCYDKEIYDCDFPTEKLLKIVRDKFARNPINTDAYDFLKKFTITYRGMSEVLKILPPNATFDDQQLGACEWVRKEENRKIWKEWVSNSYTPTAENMNYLPLWSASVANAAMSISLLLGLMGVMWTIINRQDTVVKAAQPVFLCLIVFGSWISSITIFLSSLDDRTLSKDQLDTVCVMIPWFYCIGFIFTYAPLTVKIHRATKIITCARELMIVTVTWKNAFMWISASILLESLIILIWQIRAPLVWARHCEIAVGDGICLSSKAGCESIDAWSYMTPIIFFHLFGQIHTCYMCYKANKRDIPSAYRETGWIITTLYSNIQIFALSIPLLLMASENPTSFFLVKSGSVFLNETGVILLIFIPKFYMCYLASDEKKNAANPYVTRVGAKDQEELVASEPL